MNNLIFSVSLIVLFLFAFSSYSQNKNYTSTDTEITASVGEQFTITLTSNRTTGYSWSAGMIADNSQVVVTGVEYKVPSDAKIGQGGEEVWHFKAVATGSVKIKMYYARPWENDKPAQEITYSVSVK
jgi:inhibitor of cysteine peptidase